METKFPPAAQLNKRLIGIMVATAVVIAVVVLAVTQLLMPDKVAAPLTAEVKDRPVIQITDNGFSPATLKVAAGTTVRWVNKTTSPHQVGSNPYPDRTALPGLYSGEPLAPEASYEYTFEQAGNWGYHDSTKPTMNGMVIVD